MFDSWRRHRVVNASDVRRVHLVIDLAGSSRFWQTVRQAETLSPINVLPGDGEQFALRTEQFPVAPVMAPGEMLAIVEQVLQDCEANTENDPSIMRQYRHYCSISCTTGERFGAFTDSPRLRFLSIERCWSEQQSAATQS